MNLEDFFISQFHNKQIGDDGTLIKTNKHYIVYSKDAFFENVHFKKEWMSYYQIAKKAMLVNISDAIAMNATPKFALLSVAMPKNISKKEMQELAQGFKDIAQQFGIEIVGGDTISNIKLDITITIVSFTKKPLQRVGLKQNHLLAYTGTLGKSAKDLKTLFNKGKIHKKSKFVTIQLRKDFVSKTQRYLSSGMDISDGLFNDLEKLAKLNQVGFFIDNKITKNIGCSGEEYEMLVSFDKRYLLAIKQRAKQTRTPLTIFAKSIRKKYRSQCKKHHF
ncbi:Thiamine-monophosphate kinase [hydrothermal vent metagenome]|uniref:Thiamine-monophosphate kinase n=1 Tax=hydrothermal vent metagenome TaxID=652676 RepID=A0A1W1D457_9ZZZZ